MNHSHLIIRYCNSLLIVIALSLYSHMANASVITYGCVHTNSSCTLQELFDGGSFEVEGLSFTNWTLVSSSYDTLEAPDPSLMELFIRDTEYLDGGVGPGEGPGFQFYDPQRVYGAEYRDFRYAFQVSTLSSNQVIDNNSLLVSGYGYGGGPVEGLLEVNELVTDSQDVELATKRVFVETPVSDNPPNNEKTFDFADFLPQSMIVVETGFLERGSLSNDGAQYLSLVEYYQRFGYTVVPVPPAVWLFGSGLLGLIGITRRKKSS